MKKFKIEVEEVLQKIIEVEAETLEDAITKTQEQWYNCDIVLDSDDFKEVIVREFE